MCLDLLLHYCCFRLAAFLAQEHVIYIFQSRLSPCSPITRLFLLCYGDRGQDLQCGAPDGEGPPG